MPTADFVHLRLHSAYSLLEGALKVPEIVERCRAEKMPAVAITDTTQSFPTVRPVLLESLEIQLN